MQLERAFQVTGLVLVDDVVLGQLVQHRRYLGQQRFGSAPSALSSREVARGHWELGRAFGHVPSVRLGEELADGLAAKQLGVRVFGPLRREMRRRWQWEQAAMSED